MKDRANDSAAQAGVAAAVGYHEEMERALGADAWLAGEYSYADIAFYMAALFGERHGVPVSAATPRLLEWRNRMTRRPAVRTVVAAMAQWLQAAGRPTPQFMLGV